MTTATLNGIDVYYEQRGAGQRLLFLNGSGATLATVAPLVDVYAAQFELLAHDQRGLGRTSIPDGPYSMADYAEDAAALAAHVGWDSYRVVGTSFGGMVGRSSRARTPSGSSASRCSAPHRAAPAASRIRSTRSPPRPPKPAP